MRPAASGQAPFRSQQATGFNQQSPAPFRNQTSQASAYGQRFGGAAGGGGASGQGQQQRGPRDAKGRRPGDDTTRVNQQIRAPQVRLLLPDGSQLGVVPTRDALERARQMDLDLVEVSANAVPPVCRIMDYGKWKYEEERKRKEARKNQSRTQVKEVKFHANTDVGDYALKIRNIRAFLADDNKVKLTLMFRGRENAHKELGEEVLQRVCTDLADVANVEQAPKVMGRSCTGMLSPKSQKGR